MTTFDNVRDMLSQDTRSWLITGVAGFIGSNLLERLLALNQRVVGIDNFATGKMSNIDAALAASRGSGSFKLIEGDIREINICRSAISGAEIVLHQAALGSVPRSLREPRETHLTNVDGFLNVLMAAREAGVGRVVYASSSSVYGDSAELPKREPRIGRPLSPYAATKLIDEIYASVVQRSYGLQCTGLRYFNVFGPRQDPAGEYAAVMPRWFSQLLAGEECVIFGNGNASRDFCYVENVVEANILAATAPADTSGAAYNIACGARTNLRTLFGMISERVAKCRPDLPPHRLRLAEQRPGDIQHSHADISFAKQVLGYEGRYSVSEGLDRATAWYVSQRGGSTVDIGVANSRRRSG